MIRNEHQYKVTKAQLARLEEALERTKTAKTSLQPRLRKAMIAGMEAQIAELREEINEYNLLKKQRAFKITKFEQLPELLIKARIARGLTHKQLAERLNLKPQQIQRYESTDYRTVSLARLVAIARALDVELEKCETRLIPRKGQ